MTLLGRVLDLLFALALLYISLMVGCAGIDLHAGTFSLSSQKVIVPGMLVWLLAYAAGLVRWHLAVRVRRASGAAGPELTAHTDGGDSGDRADGTIVAEVADRADRPDGGESGDGADGAKSPQGLAPYGLPLRAGLVLAAALCALALHRAVGRPFVMDDLMMVDSASVLDGTVLANMFRGRGWSTPGFIRPLPELLWWLELKVHGCVPLLCHLANLGLHLVNVLLVGVIARRLVPGAPRAGWAMLLFAVAGTHAEPLLWLSSRYDLMAATFGLASLASYLRYLDEGDRRALAASAVCTVLSLFSKEAALTLPIGMAALALVHVRPRPVAARLAAGVIPIAVLAVFFAYRMWVLGGLTGVSHSGWIDGGKLLQLPLSPLAPLTWPVNIEQMRDLDPGVRALLAASLALVPLWGVRRLEGGPDRITLAAIGLLAVAAIPVHNVISLAATLKQSRYLYLPAAFFAILVVELTRGLPRGRAALGLSLVVAANFCLLRSNAEPYAAAGAVVARALEQSVPLSDALRGGATILVRGLPLQYRGVPACSGYTVLVPVTRAAGVPITRLYVENDRWREQPAGFGRAFRWAPDRGFVEEAP